MQELLGAHAAETASMVLPAALMRRLAVHRQDDSVLRLLLKQLGTLAEPPAADGSAAAGELAGRHGIAGAAGVPCCFG